ncbi:MAG TPA: helix-turn-helix transcriptional regulator [Pyrinomonadaceae bacterium]|nr:helix-turn-helix transcriptional regulator [Pyrinomonadaceae bacterium]
MGRAARLRSARLAEKLRHIRDALGLSQNELIRRLGLEGVIYQSNVSGYESGEREPPLPILLKYAQLAGVCLDTLANDDLKLPAKLPAKPKHS